jgi:hypothetical protein
MKHLALSVAGLFVAYVFLVPPAVVQTGPVADALRSASSSDRAKVAAIYHALADVVQRDGGQRITTTVVWRSIYRDALALAAGGTDLVGKYKGLDTAIESVLAQHYSLDTAAIDSALAAKIAAGCKAVETQSGG